MKCKTTRRLSRCLAIASAAALASTASAQSSSISAWDASDFRIWGYIPYWTTTSEINSFASSGLYSHVSDVLHFGGYRPDASGNIAAASSSYATQLTTIRSQMQTYGFKLHLSMFEVNGGLGTDATWQSIINSPTNRANFVTQVKSLLQGGAGTADDLKGFNFDWERPATASDWGNYTQLARELRTAINPLGMEVSVCDYGSTDTDWDGTSLFDAKVYDQLMMMVYHLSASSSATWANTKLALTGQGAAKAFADNQITIGIGTWGTGGPSTVGLDQIVAVNPNIAYDQSTYNGTIGSSTGTWTIESRKQVREKTQLALDRGMPGMFTWTLHYDAQNNMGLHRVMHHYAMVKTGTPDLNLDGKVDANDSTALLNNFGSAITNTGMATAAEFDAFYLGGNWEKGDHDGNGFVNQADADWLKNRYTALGVNLPDKLPFTGTFESFANSKGLTGRWRGGRNASNQLLETSNFKQEAANFLSWSGSGAGANQRSNNFVTIRNQSAAEVSAATNGATRSLNADLTTAIDTSQNKDWYFTFLAKENLAAMSPAQLASSNRTLSLEFLDSLGSDQFDFVLRGLQKDLSILHEADPSGQDTFLAGGTEGATYFVVGKISGNGTGANSLRMSAYINGSDIGDFTLPGFAWMLTANSSAGYNPVITDVQFTSLADSSFTVSNLWLGDAQTMAVPEPAALGLIALAGVPLARRRRRSR